MATLIAVGYDNAATAAQAAEEIRRLSRDLIVEPDAVAVISRDTQGDYHVSTNHHGAGARRGMFWGLLFGLLFFVPAFGLAGPGVGALFAKIEQSGINKQFAEQVREMLRPSSSALFLIIEKATPDEAVAALSKFGGKVLESPLSVAAEEELPEALPGAAAAQA